MLVVKTPPISGRDIISDATEKSQARLLLVASTAIVAKAYQLPVEEIEMVGMKFPPAIFDVSLLLLVFWYSYTYLVKRVGDLLGFRLWYTESSIWSQFGTNLKIDKRFISGGIEAIKEFRESKMKDTTEENLKDEPEEKKQLYEEFLTNVDLYATRLASAGRKFRFLSWFGHFYIWVQGFLIPIGLAVLAIYFLLKYGTFYVPEKM